MTNNISYLIISSPKIDEMYSFLFSKRYKISEIQKYHNDIFERTLFLQTDLPKSDIRADISDLLRIFDHNEIIVKFAENENPIKVFSDSPNRELSVLMYNTDSSYPSYINEGISFSFIEQKKYTYPKKKEDFKLGMVVECYSENGWIKKKVTNVDKEFNSIYSTLSKYDKVRF